MNTSRRIAGARAQRTRQPRLFWPRALPTVARHVADTMPWVTLVAGCLAGTALLALLAHIADTSHTALNQDKVRFAFLPAVTALAFVPHSPFRPVTQITPAPAWLTSAGQTLLAVPVLAATCWVQLRIMTATIPLSTPGHPRAIYPLIAQLTGWCALTVAAAACVERSRYADLGGAVAAPFSLAVIALAWITPGITRILATPPATPYAVTIAWYITAAAASAVTCVAMRDQWHRYTRILHGGHWEK